MKDINTVRKPTVSVPSIIIIPADPMLESNFSVIIVFFLMTDSGNGSCLPKELLLSH